MAYDVGKITRDLQTEFELFAKTPEEAAAGETRATPEGLATLIAALERLTESMVDKRDEMSDWTPDAGIVGWDSDFAKWRGRLGAYREAVDAAEPGDRAAVFWSVTAPLLLGFFGGESSRLPQQPMDAGTPFSLANQLETDEAWRDERLRLFVEDVKQGAKDVLDTGLGIGKGLLIVGGVVGGAWILKTLFSK